MRKFLAIPALIVTSFVSGCGGGGDNSGQVINAPYSITLRADSTQLPLNPASVGPGIGAYSPFTTTLYAQGRKGGGALPEGTEISCSVETGLESGALYYLDGTDKKDENDVLSGSRAIVLKSNSGINTFHFHAGNSAGKARIKCTVTSPTSNTPSSASVEIVVGAATGQPASVQVFTQTPGFLGALGNFNGFSSNLVVQAFVLDDANQPVAAPPAANLQVSIRPNGASSGARLLSGLQSGSVLQLRTVGGIGEFSLASGLGTGPIILEFVADRFDNNVNNGIQDPVASVSAIGVIDGIASEPLAITSTVLAGAREGFLFTYALEAKGGLPPYTWSAAGGLPSGVSLTSSGVIQGTPLASGAFSFAVQVRDRAGTVSTSNLTLDVTPAPPPPAPPISPLSISGCGGSLTTCQLPDAISGVQYVYAFSAVGGDPSKAIMWDFTPQPPAPGLLGGQAGSNGTLSGTLIPTTVEQCNFTFLVTATRDQLSVTQPVKVKIAGGVCPAA